MTYSDEFLVSELKRFYYENGRVPTQLDIGSKYGYPSVFAYITHFGFFNNALEIAELIPNHIQHVGKLDGTETCTYCGKRADEIPNFKGWLYPGGVRYCMKHGNNGKGIPDYVLGILDINCEKGLGRAGEILVAKVLKIGKEHDYNRENCNVPIDMYHEDYGKIDVKTGLFHYNSNNWAFSFDPEKVSDTYICIGLSSNRKRVEHVWIVPNEGKIRYLQTFSITNSYRSLFNRRKWEIDVKPYNDTWKTMNLNDCKIMVDKRKDNYIEPVKHGNIVNNTIKQVEYVIDKAQQRLVDF